MTLNYLSPDGIGTLRRAHPPSALALLLGAGLFATLAQVAMTRAYRLGKTLVTANLQYTGIVFSSLWGVVFLGDAPGWSALAGMALILASGSATTFYNVRKGRIVAAQAATEKSAVSHPAR